MASAIPACHKLELGTGHCGQAPISYLPASPNIGRWLAWAWLILAYDHSLLWAYDKNWAGPGKSSSGVTKSRKMTFRAWPIPEF